MAVKKTADGINPISADKLGMIGVSEKFAIINKLITRDLNGRVRNPYFTRYSKDDIMKYLEDPNKYEKELFFNFLHSACFYLGYNTRPSERTYHNLIKLAQATATNQENPDNISPYEIICNDYVVAEKSNDMRFQDGFLPYYINYKRLANNTDVSQFLTKALKDAIGPYTKVKNQRLKSA